MVPDWKTKGKRRTLADSFGDAARGILFAVKTERNMRIHVTAAVYVLFFARFLGVSRGEYAALLLAVALVITAEGFNTAIEMLCDYAQKSYNRFIGRTKDIAAGAVLISAVFAAFVGVTVLWRPRALWALAVQIFTSLSDSSLLNVAPTADNAAGVGVEVADWRSRAASCSG